MRELGPKKTGGVNELWIQYIPDEVYTAFVEQVKSQSVLFGEEVNKDVAIVYSPLNGTGLKPVTRTLKEMGYTNITVVKEQERPDGNFPTCPYPNPEIKEAMALGMEYLDSTQILKLNKFREMAEMPLID